MNVAKISLSRLQVVRSWLLISAFFAAAISKHTMGILDTTNLSGCDGISVGSAAGSVIVKGNKINQQPRNFAAAVSRNSTHGRSERQRDAATGIPATCSWATS